MALEQEMIDSLWLAAAFPEIWEYTLHVARSKEEFNAMIAGAMAERDERTRWPYAVRLSNGDFVGSTSFFDYSPRHGTVEIGGTWYRPDLWRTGLNRKCKLLMLTHAFETLNVRRVALVTDALNQRSQAAILGIGAQPEGILRKHYVTSAGRVRDTMVFSIVDDEWPDIKTKLSAKPR